MLEVRELSAGYGSTTVLRDVELRIDAGEVVVLLGPNGAGKTTLLRALTGSVRAHGDLRFAGASLARTTTDGRARLGIAHVPQGRGTFTDLTVEENLLVGGYTRRDREARADLDRWYDFFPRLGERRHQLAGSMSGGEQQMLAVARALMLRPRLLLLDEPSLGLAPVVTQALFRQLGRLSTETALTMLVVEQAAHLALGIASRAYTLTHGTISAPLSPQDLADQEELRRVYLGAAHAAGQAQTTTKGRTAWTSSSNGSSTA
ncbi:MAG: ABC transporter ATP-binding protein [Nocardioidaceae bacterium]|nr:ABC transporter ATP-binding protein [Nocardioidaceae bacterium]